MHERNINYEIRQLDKKELLLLDPLNRELFGEKRIINRTDHEFMVILAAFVGDIPIGFKVGYGMKNNIFYSAKGGVLINYRKAGIAKALLQKMIKIAELENYNVFTYDTFPNMHYGMLIMGLKEGFSVSHAGWNAQYNDYQITLSKVLK